MDKQLSEQFGNIDIYLFDQLLKGRFSKCKRILDVGCGNGRNLHYFLRNGYDVYGIDNNYQAIETVRSMCAQLAPDIQASNFIVANADSIPFDKASFDLVICSAVLHFAEDKRHFESMLQASWDALKPGGYFFSRLASLTGIEHLAIDISNGRYILPDGSERFLVDHDMLMHYTHALNGTLYEPIKTTNVHNMRCMATWCLQKQ